jgi:hypothetical protein
MPSEEWKLTRYGFPANFTFRASHIQDEAGSRLELVERLQDCANGRREDGEIDNDGRRFRFHGSESARPVEDLGGIDAVNTDAAEVLF